MSTSYWRTGTAYWHCVLAYLCSWLAVCRLPLPLPLAAAAAQPCVPTAQLGKRQCCVPHVVIRAEPKQDKETRTLNAQRRTRLSQAANFRLCDHPYTAAALTAIPSTLTLTPP